MPRNEGLDPFYDYEDGIPPLVDIQFRNGRVVRATESKKWRWTPWPEHPDWDFDITSWQLSGSKAA